MRNLTTTSTVKTYPRLPYERMKDDVLGKKYQLSLVFIGESRAKALNIQNRKKNYVPNVLSFPLEETVGEIYIAPTIASREAKKHGMSTKGYIGFLFIHGLLHLKGHRHGATMEKAEKRLISKYKLI